MSILIPGAAPPFIIPFCKFCDLPVERFTFMPVTSPYWLELEAQCCNRTQGIRVSVDEVLRVKRSGEKLFAVVKPGSYQHVGDLKRATG